MSWALLSENIYGGMILACEEGRQLLSVPRASSLTSLFLLEPISESAPKVQGHNRRASLFPPFFQCLKQ